MIKNNKWKALISSLLILIPTLLGAIFADRIEAPHAEDAALLFLPFPCILLGVHWLCLLVTARDNSQNSQSPKVLSMLFWICPILSFYVGGVTLAVMLGLSFNLYVILCLMTGVGFILIGNYMPKTKPNHTVGIRIKWTLESDENWTKTHRFCGKVWVITGAVALLAVFLPERILPCLLAALILAACIIPTVYSYILYQKQLQNGLVPKKITAPMPKWAIILTAVLLTVTLLGTVVLCFTGNVESTCTDTELTVKSTYWKDLTLAYTEVDAIEYRDSVEGDRINGFGSPHLSLGWFRSEEFGNYTRYTYTKINPCIVLTVGSEIFVVNCATDAETQALYNELIVRIGG